MDNTTIRLSRRAMNCTFEIIAASDNKAYLIDVTNKALDYVERLDQQLTYFSPTSEVSYINSEAFTRPVTAEPGLFELLQMAKRVWQETGGGFDVTAGPLIALWREADKTGNAPSKKAIERALSKVSMSHVVLNEAAHTVSHTVYGVSINLGAIGKGYAVERAAEVLREYGICSALISAGRSTVRAIGDQPGGSGWNIGIRHPSKLDEHITTINLKDQALSTSGGVEQRDESVVETFEHIVDPRDGSQARPNAASVSVIADDAALADALSTSFYLLGRGFAEQYCRDHEGISALFVERCGEDYAVTRIRDERGETANE